MTPEQREAVRELAVGLAIDRYGDPAILRPSPPGPDQCSATCSWCYHQGVAVLPVAQPTETELAEGVG